MPAPVVAMRGVGKSFNGIRVLDDVDFDLAPGEVHALVGGNGAGKSTLMKILEGVYSLDEGRIEMGGEPVSFSSALDARRNGIAMIFQEFSLIPTLSVAQNVFLTRESRGRTGLLDDRECERRARETFADMRVAIDVRRKVGELSTAYWQLTEIAKALTQDARVLIMDEPTSSLATSETEALFALMGRLKERGISIVYISHRLEEVFTVADRITVLRDGRVIGTSETRKTTIAEVIEQIVGRKIGEAMRWRPRVVERSGEPVLRVRDLVSGDRVRGVGFDLYPGEVIGIAGLMGSGRTELARVLFGVDRPKSGQVLLRGKPLRVRSTSEAIKAGIALIPEDRRTQGLVLDHSLRDNLLLPVIGGLSRGGFVDDRRGNTVARKLMERFNIVGGSPSRPARLLSGGNQQKVVIAKWLGTEPDVLIMDEPTVGVDVGTKHEIVEMIRTHADAGKAFIVISSELPELLAVSDRVLVLRAGRVVQELDRAEIESEQSLHHAVQGVAVA